MVMYVMTYTCNSRQEDHEIKPVWATQQHYVSHKSRAAHSCHPSIEELEAGRLPIQGRPEVRNEFQISLGYIMKPWKQEQGLWYSSVLEHLPSLVRAPAHPGNSGHHY